MNLNATLLGQMIAFALFVWFCWKFVWPPLLAAMEERAKKIEQGLKDSEAGAKKIVEAEGFSVVKDFCGHGIGKKFHENPNVLHYMSLIHI